MVPVIGVDHAPTTAFATEAYTCLPSSVPAPNQLGSASVRGLEAPSMVSYHAMLTIVVANY